MNARKSLRSHIFNAIILLVLCSAMPMQIQANMERLNQKIDRMQTEKEVKSKVSVLSREEKQQQQKKETHKPLPKHKQQRMRRIEKAKNENSSISTMDYQGLKESKNKLLANNDKETAIKYLEQMLKLCDDINLIAQLLLELADLYFDTGDLQKSELLYSEFVHLYPGNDSIEYAQYKAIVCSFYATLDHERDQTKTHDTIELTDTFLQRGDVFKKYNKDVKKIRTQCYQKIVDSEVQVFNFYLKRGSIKSAEKRLDGLKTEWLNLLPEIKPHVIALEQELENKKNELAGNKPVKRESSSTEKSTTLAQGKEKRSFAQRF